MPCTCRSGQDEWVGGWWAMWQFVRKPGCSITRVGRYGRREADPRIPSGIPRWRWGSHSKDSSIQGNIIGRTCLALSSHWSQSGLKYRKLQVRKNMIYIDGSIQDYARALEILQSCTKPSMCPTKYRPTLWYLMFISKKIQQFCTKPSVYTEWLIFNLLWPSDAIWRQRSQSTLAQLMACCLTAPSHYLNQRWLIISEFQWHSY